MFMRNGVYVQNGQQVLVYDFQDTNYNIYNVRRISYQISLIK